MDMDTSLTIKPRDSSARSGHARPNAVRTELAPSQSVIAKPAIEAPHAPAPVQDNVGRDLVDPQSREVIYRARDENERNRKRRPPDEALMRQRAYGRPALAPDQPHNDEPDTHADFEV
jgi:hypothetical protein